MLQKRRPRLLTIKAEAEVKEKTSSSPSTKKKEVEYKEVIEPKTMNLSEGLDLVFSVSEAVSDEGARIDIRTYITTERYTGPTKKGINFPVELLEEFKEFINEIDEALQKRGI